MNTENVLSSVIELIKNYVPNTYEWVAPEKFSPPALIFRPEVKQRPTRLQLYKRLPDKTLWKISDTELMLYLFYVDKAPTFASLNEALSKLTAVYAGEVKAFAYFSPFAPSDRDEFKKLGLRTWEASLRLKFPEVVEKPVFTVEVEISHG